MNGRIVRFMSAGALAEFKQLANGIAESDRRARGNRGDPRDYTFDPNPPKPSEPKKCPNCGSKHQFGRMTFRHQSRSVKHYSCGRCGNSYSYDKDWRML